jgi:hypothetical protein
VINSLQKGKRAEREWAIWLKHNLACPNARRSQQYQGLGSEGDVVSDIEGLHWEIKAVQRLNLDQAMAQASRDCLEKIPLVAHKKNRSGWCLTMKASDIERFVTIVSEHLQGKV